MQVRYNNGTVGNWEKYRTFRHKTVLIGNSTVQNRTMLGEKTVQDRTLRGNKLKCHELFKKHVNQNFRRKKGTKVEFGDGPSGWSRWRGQSRGSQKPPGTSRDQYSMTVQVWFLTVQGKDRTLP